LDTETLSHIFEPFFTTKGLGKGTGLGLSTVYGIVKQSDGHIWAYSEPGQGTTFKIYLPVRTGPVAEAEPLAQPQQVGRGEWILLVEDEVPLRSMMKRSLEHAGYRVLEAGRLAEALDCFTRAAQPIGLVLTDVVMPGGSGLDLARQVAGLRPGVPVLFTSGYTEGDIQRKALLPPEAAFLQKPVTPDTLVRAARHAHRTRRDPTRAGTHHQWHHPGGANRSRLRPARRRLGVRARLTPPVAQLYRASERSPPPGAHRRKAADRQHRPRSA
jgi:two-component system, cell cycle sensor histidine kinase and response regulator CckA